MTTPRHLVVTVAESSRADALADTLRDSVTVRTAYGTESLRETLSEDVDVVLVDPDTAGLTVDDVHEAIRERGLPCELGVLTDAATDRRGVTAVDPDAAPAALCEAVERLADRAVYRRKLETLYDLASEYAAARADDDTPGDAVAELEERFERHREETRAVRTRLADGAAMDIALGELR